jgi:hypothetical protein
MHTHTRRDFLAEKGKPLSIDYFKIAIDLAKKIINSSKFYIFSDNLFLARKELFKIKGITSSMDIEFIDYKNPDYVKSSMHDFTAMSNCTNNIISNSTYSFWAAYLNKNPNKVVIAPYNKFDEPWYDTNGHQLKNYLKQLLLTLKILYYLIIELII